MTDFEAKQAIQELVFKYCRAVDRRDFDSLKNLYHKDSIGEHGAMFTGSGAEFIEWLPAAMAGMRVTCHTVSNHLITVKGQQGEGEVYCQAYHLSEDNQEIIIGGRYLDKYIFDEYEFSTY